MTKTTTAALAALFASCASSFGATPIISGTYSVAARSYCQPVLTANFSPVGSDSYVDNLSKSNSDAGDAFSQQILSANFNPAKGKVTVTGFQDEGSVFLLQFTGSKSGVVGTPLAEQAAQSSNKYSNTATTFTVNNDTSNAFYSGIDAHGIAHSFIFMRLSGGQGGTNCSTQGEATLQ